MEAQVAAVLVIVADVGPYEANEMTVAEDDYILEELSTTAADPALGRSRFLSATDCGKRCEPALCPLP